MREQIAEIVGEATDLAVSTSPDYWCGWRHECDGEVYLLADRILSLFALHDAGGPPPHDGDNEPRATGAADDSLRDPHVTATAQWFADTDPDAPNPSSPWVPVLSSDGCCFPLPLWFTTAEECEAFIASIPAGRAALQETGGRSEQEYQTLRSALAWCSGYIEVTTGSVPKHVQDALDMAARETGGPEPAAVRKQIAEIVREATAWCGWQHERDGDVDLLTDRILALIAVSASDARNASSDAEIEQPTPPRCPTCGADEPGWLARVDPCTDSWHARQPTPDVRPGPIESNNTTSR